MNDSSSAMYDSLAEHYRSYSENRSAYIGSVDRFIIRGTTGRPQSLLDVGAGDGVRGMGLAKALEIPHTTLFDSSREMFQRCRELGATEVIFGQAEALPNFGRKFDVVLMLWNVLGHLEGVGARIAALRGIAASMTEESVFYLDVNNRHNGSTYGWSRALGRVIVDSLIPDVRRGDVSYTWVVDGKSLPGKGHLFTMREVRGLLLAAGLSIREQVFVHYATGVVSRNRFKGQIVLKIGLAK